ncbi:MAG: NADH-quinone oxidoreductase subunit L, partial [Cyanobacteria bacterium]|nr:NADH-quinone oxidoreductase subunit L [Cyanobacteriota bacterium]
MSTDFLKTCVENAWVIVALPFFVGTFIILSFTFSLDIGKKRVFKSLSMAASVSAVLWGLFHSFMIFLALNSNSELSGWQQNFDWFVCGDFTLSVGVLVDNLTSMMLIVVTAISLFVQIYTHGYMREDPGYARFYCYLSLFTGSMLGLVVSTNMFQTYAFWELVGVCSYFLIGFWWYKESAAQACVKAFVVNRIGDFGFLVGILMLYLATKSSWAGGTAMLFTSKAQGGIDLPGALKLALESGTLTPEFGLIATSLPLMAFLIFMGPMAKSAQFPLHVWLPDAMEGPTPISALIHAATMVAAGIYLVARAYPIFHDPSGAVFPFVAITGTITAFMAATIALSQNDIKRVLAWSTCSQLGYMMAALGVGAYSAALFHLFTHAFFKAMLFLGSGAVILGCHHEQDIRKMGGLAKAMPIVNITFLIGTLTISGFPLLSAWFSKDEIISGAFHLHSTLGDAIGAILILTAGMTAFYMFRLYIVTFLGEYRGDHKPFEVGRAMTYPLVFLAVPSIFAGGILGFSPKKDFMAAFNQFVSQEPFINHWSAFVYWQHPHAEGVNLTVMGISTVVALAGMALAFPVYLNSKSGVAQSVKAFVASGNPLWQFSYRKWMIDDLYLYLLNKVILPVYRTIWKWVDIVVIDNIVNGSSLATIATGEGLKYTQTGRGQYYALVIFL